MMVEAAIKMWSNTYDWTTSRRQRNNNSRDLVNSKTSRSQKQVWSIEISVKYGKSSIYDTESNRYLSFSSPRCNNHDVMHFDVMD